MTEKELKVIIKAKELCKHTFVLTSNANRYPKKYRHSLVDRMQLKSIDIYTELFEANRTSNITDKQERLKKISNAITYCDELLFLIELSMQLNLLSDGSMAYWTEMICDVKYMAIAWRTKERN
ncbi:MAG: four helix bundle protein [Clostridia bacterium]|nr:four helix bundle protein [Clostridia bacterium]